MWEPDQSLDRLARVSRLSERTALNPLASHRKLPFLQFGGLTMEMARRRWIGVTAGAVVGGLAASAALANAVAMAGATFEIYQDSRREYRWRLKARNGQVIATAGQGYKSKADCRHGVELVQKEASSAKVEELAAKE
jgi:uncharacterized protein YegP (UPF0339 family)